ncbi:hypothetical protein [Agrobacterium rubi]|uniref:CDP-Glycerol:Poly(Glycerophosphate) glycerophosphotransferase n=1 Tax=Agrobacterium rubi TaxID=28099 RepID=A0AAE7R4F0_9HYPH|nr:hypothetical protein [Agrobacterium rubi]NTF35822.1 hypothetical protein [Agrobacterium rubi]OCJ48286.1 hypothetical protein A6U92_08820 [Agrobacterium rubi]QTG00929.1 hypothetical protein G6M88_11250 [Agrobacterium rubi]
MDMTTNSASSSTVNDKLDKVIADLSALTQRQQIQDEIMLELVNFLARFREDAIGIQNANSQKLHEASQGIAQNVRDLTQSNASFANNLVESLKNLALANETTANNNFAQLRQVMHTGIRKMPNTSGKIRCVFLVHMIEAWDAQIDIFHAMANDDRFDPIVISIDRVFPGDNACGGESSISQALTELGVAHLRLGMPNSFEGLDVLRALAPDVIFRQSHWDRDYPPAFRTAELGFTRLCAITYGTSIVAKFSHSERNVAEISPMAFDQPYHRSAWRVFCETEQTQSYFRSFQHSDPSKFVLSGYPKHERLASFIGKGSWPIENAGTKAYRVIWAPHHSVGDDWLAFGVFHRMYRDMLRWAQRSPHIEFALKPHPALFALVVKMGLLSQASVDDFKLQWESLPNCTIVEGQYGELFDASDLMLTDGISFLTEYQLFNKPLIFIDSQRRVPFNTLGELASACADHATTMEQIEATVTAYANGKPWGYAEARERLLEKLLPNERPSTEIVLDAIAGGMSL